MFTSDDIRSFDDANFMSGLSPKAEPNRFSTERHVIAVASRVFLSRVTKFQQVAVEAIRSALRCVHASFPRERFPAAELRS
jgi:hypothetical protein